MNNELERYIHTYHLRMAEHIAQNFGAFALLSLVLAHLHNGTKFGVVCAMLSMFSGYATWRVVVMQFSVGVIGLLTVLSQSFGWASLFIYIFG